MSFSHQHQDAQQRHTNIAVVRLKKGGKKFEVAAYRNKVVSWRSGAETNIDEVLQVVTVFENVSRGIHASKADLQKCFGTTVVLDCCKIILKSGELQVGEKEREAEYTSKFHDIATLVANRCVNSQTGWPYTPATIETCMRDTIHFAVNPGKSTKQQASEVIERLKEHMPIARARMHIKVTVSGDPEQHIEGLIKAAGTGSEEIKKGPGFVELLANPSNFRDLEQFVKSIEAKLIILEFSEISKSKDVDLDDMVMLSSGKDDHDELVPKPTPSTVVVLKDGRGDVRCNSCDMSFGEDRTAQRAHYKTDFHTFNVKLKNTGLPTVTSEEYSKMSEEDKRAVLFDWKVDN